MGETIAEWVTQIDEEVNSGSYSAIVSPPKEEPWKKHSIYRIPSRIRELNKKDAYNPQAVSLGPYHHNDQHLEAMREHKHRALVHFLRRREKTLAPLLKQMEQVVQQLMESYKPLDGKWTQDKQEFLKLMIVDGCFIFEILRISDRLPRDDHDYDKSDPVFSEHGKLDLMPYIKRDMLMLENQLPIMVLHKLFHFYGTTEVDVELKQRIVECFFPKANTSDEDMKKMDKCKHVLDVYRKYLILHDPSPRYETAEQGSPTGDEEIFSAKELLDHGIRLRKSPTKSFKDVSFTHGVLRLPTVVLDDNSEFTFLNIIAFERLDVETGYEVTSYIYFLDTLIDDEKDVEVLCRRGILINALSTNKDVIDLFYSLSKDITLDRQGVMGSVQMAMNKHCNRPFNNRRARIVDAYLRNIWTIISFIIGTILVLFLTILQTGFSIADYYQPHDSGSHPRPHRP